MGVLDAGQSAGTALCFVVGALALHFLSWRWAFWGLAAAGVILAVITSRRLDPVVFNPVARLEGGRRPGDPSLISVLTELIHVRTNLVVLVADAVATFFYAGVTSFAVVFATERYGLSAATVDAVAPIVGVAVIAGLLAGGRLGDRVAGIRGGGSRLLLASVTDLVAAALLAPAIWVRSLPVSGALLLLAATVLAAGGPCLDAVRLDVVRPAIRGRAEAARGLITLSSSAIAPVTFGVLAMALGGHGHHGAGLRDAFLLMLLPLAASGCILLAGVGHYRSDAAAANGGAPLGLAH